jgi:hypothetical protein
MAQRAGFGKGGVNVVLTLLCDYLEICDVRGARMTEATENLILRLLQEMWQEMVAFRSDVQRSFDLIDARFAQVEESIADLTARFDGLTHITVMLANRQAQHEARIEALEAR